MNFNEPNHYGHGVANDEMRRLLEENAKLYNALLEICRWDRASMPSDVSMVGEIGFMRDIAFEALKSETEEKANG